MNKKWIELHGPFISLLILTIIVLYSGITPSFSSDDYVHLLNNTKFKNISEALVVFTEPYGREYRPLVRISMWLNHLMGGTALPFKITNVLLHLLTTFFIFRILNKLQFSALATLLATAIFALHPIHITSIHFILGRTDLIAAVFYFGTLVLVTEWKSRISIGQYVVASATLIAALLSKEMSVTLSLMMFAVAFHNQKIKNRQTFVNVLVKLAPFFLITFAYVIIRILMWSKLVNDVAGYTNYSLQHVLINYANWFFALVYPFDLYRVQDFMVENPVGFFSAVIACVSIILSMPLVLYGRNLFSAYKLFWLWVALIWICVTLLPICGGNPHRWYLYIPSFGLCLLVAAIIDVTEQKKLLLAFVGFLLIIYSIEDFRLSNIWNKQSAAATEILKQIESDGIYKKERVYFANIPFGFASAYLFTLSSLQEAMQYTFGKSPEVVAVSYVNIDDGTKIITTIDGNNINFKITPDHYNFFLLSAMERRFDRSETRNKENVLIKINGLATNKKISDYTVSVPEDIKHVFYYFDQQQIKSLAEESH